MKKTIILTLIGAALSCLAITLVKNSELNTKADIASYLTKHHYHQEEINGIMSNATKNHHNIMYDETF